MMNGSWARGWLGVVCLAAATGASAQIISGDGTMRLTLDGALAKEVVVDGQRKIQACPLVVDCIYRDSNPQAEVWGYAHQYNRAEHHGKLKVIASDQQSLELSLAMIIAEDGWWPGGGADFRVRLTKTEAGPVTGTFEGAFGGRQVKGAVGFRLLDDALRPPDQTQAFAPMPRLIYTRDELATLRQRAQTPQGQAMLKSARGHWEAEKNGFGHGGGRALPGGEGFHAASHGFMYQLENEEARSMRARLLLMRGMQRAAAQDDLHVYARRVMGAALAYDSCGHRWDESFRKQVRDYLRQWSRYWTRRPDDLRPQDGSVQINRLDPSSPELAMYRAAAGMAALALVDSTVEPPPRVATSDIAAVDEKAFGEQAPQPVAFAHDRVLTQWLVLHGLREDPQWRPWLEDKQRDVLASIGGAAEARPTEGTRVIYRGATAAFVPLAPERIFSDAYTDYRPAIDLLRDVHHESQTLDCYYTVIQNEQARFVKLDLGDRYLWQAAAWLSGQRIREHEVVRLEPGRHTLLLVVRLPLRQTGRPYYPALYGRTDTETAAALRKGRRANWHRDRVMLDDGAWRDEPAAELFMSPRLIEVENPETKWVEAYDAWRRNGGKNLEARKTLAIALRSVDRYLDHVIGREGWAPATRADAEAMSFVGAFLHAYGKATGREVIGGSQLSLAPGVLTARGDLLGAYCPILPILAGHVPADDRPVMRRMMDASVSSTAEPTSQCAYGMRRPHLLPYALLHYPFGEEAGAPGDGPDRTRPDARGFGWVASRRELGGPQVRFVVHENRSPARMAGTAGDLWIEGLGVRWTGGGDMGGTAEGPGRANTVLMQGTLPAGGAVMDHFNSEADGVTTATFDMGAIYRGARIKSLRSPWPVDVIGPTRATGDFSVVWASPDRWYDAGIRAQRMVAADYTGLGGAPAVFVVVDRFEHARNRAKQWRMHLPESRRNDMAVFADGNAIQVVKRNASGGVDRPYDDPPRDAEVNMRITFISPMGKPAVIPGLEGTLAQYDLPAKAQREGEDGFFVVITLQCGAPPRMKVTGEGLDATVRVGRRVIRIADGRVVLSRVQD